ncbi:MAG: hypothetical protein CMF59_18275 [Leptospiraceae bacterium]|nr:hypothetical protein [Leptospiraceae bacterium]
MLLDFLARATNPECKGQFGRQTFFDVFPIIWPEFCKPLLDASKEPLRGTLIEMEGAFLVFLESAEGAGFSI